MIVEGYTPKERKKVRGELVSDKYNNVRVIETEDHERVVIVNHVYKDFEGNVFLSTEIAEEFSRRKKELGVTDKEIAKATNLTENRIRSIWFYNKTREAEAKKSRKAKEKIWNATQPIFKERTAKLKRYRETFPRRLKEVREKNNLTYEDVAKALGVTAETVKWWELDGKTPGIRSSLNLLRWCDEHEK